MKDNLYQMKDIINSFNLKERELTNWLDKGLIKPYKDTKGAGYVRNYNYDNLLEIMVCKYLYEFGFSLSQIKILMDSYRKFAKLNISSAKYFIVEHKNIVSLEINLYAIKEDLYEKLGL